MRFEDWDILLFPRECKTPLKEFNVACHLVHDLEFSHTHGSAGLPTVCCFVPSLPAGNAFQVSIHSWNGAPISRYAKSYSSYADCSMLQVRLFIDGRHVSSRILDRGGSWPNVLACSLESGKPRDYDTLKFPSFRQEVLGQDYWSPADELGRIKIVISEGFPRDSLTNSFQRVNNIVAFSFQHAPLKVLEGAGIAWPNPSLWQRAPFVHSTPLENYSDSATFPATQTDRRAVDGSQMSGVVLSAENQDSIRKHRFESTSSSQDFAQFGVDKDSFGDATAYFEWLGNLNTEMAGGPSLQLAATPCGSRSRPKNSTDASMPDFQSVQPGPPCDDDALFGPAQVPTNTPDQDATYMPLIFPEGNPIPSAIAKTLTKALLDHPPPVPVHASQLCGPSNHVGSRKENLPQGHRAESSQRTISPALMPTDELKLPGSRKPSQALTQLSGVGTDGASLRDASLTSTTHSAHIVLSQPSSPIFPEGKSSSQRSSKPDEACQQGIDTSIGAPRFALSATSGNAMPQGSKRSRNPTPLLSKGHTGYEENATRRVSPRLSPSQFTARVGSQSPTFP